MNRPLGRLLALFSLLLLPSLAAAQQEPPHTKETKNAEKFIGLAMTRQDAASKRPFLEQALAPLQQAMQKNPENARVWLMAGSVYAGLGNYSEADAAFDKAEQLHPGYSEQIAGEREVAWVAAFNEGIALMDQQKYDEAITYMELAEVLYPHRPESKMNLGALYASKGDTEKAEQAFRGALTAINGPLKDKLKPEDAAQWQRYAEMARINISQMVGQRGVEKFEAREYDEAIKAFRDAGEVNPYSRDYIFNLAQSLFAKASTLEERRQTLLTEEKAARTKKDAAAANAKAAEAKALGEQISALYAELEPVVAKARNMDPNNEDLVLLLLRSYKIRGDLATDAATKATMTRHAADLLKQHESLMIEVGDIAIQTTDTEAIVKGNVHSLKAAAGTPVTIRLTLLGINGETVGQQDITVSTPAAEQSASFEAKTPIKADVAGWKYEIVRS